MLKKLWVIKIILFSLAVRLGCDALASDDRIVLGSPTASSLIGQSANCVAGQNMGAEGNRRDGANS